MIVATSDFNMGAMENKGLNIFNTKYVLASQATATDVDYANIESVVGHEYFHNWTGNRVTCRDWFQLTLKEGLTVFRDQEFSADLLAESASSDAMVASARAVQRIENVRFLRSQQFAEDAGPMAHPIRPDSYQEINNFYTVTVYEKGAEVIRMLQTLVGQAGFRRGMDLYFARHDGQAVACDDFVAAIADANERDLDQFRRWYETAGTPHVFARGNWDSNTQRYTLHLAQWLPAVAGRMAGMPDRPLHIPIAVGLLGADGTDLIGTQLIELTEAEQEVTFEGIHAEPVPSLGRGFSAPIILDFPYRTQDLVHLIAFDSDPFNRWEAGQRLAVTAVLSLLGGDRGLRMAGEDNPLDALVNVLRGILSDPNLAADFKAQMLSLPSEGYVAEQIGVVNPVALRDARNAVERHLAQHASAEWDRAWQATSPLGPYQPDPVSASRRALRNLALRMRILAGECQAMAQASDQLLHTDNMTDRLGALHALGRAPAAAREPAIEAFERLLSDERLAMDKWFAHQAMLHHQTGDIAVLERVRTLTQHPAYSARNPNRVRALIGSFCHGNLAEFHALDGSGYRFWADQVLEAAAFLKADAGADDRRVLGFTLTSYVAGQPFRMSAVRRMLAGLAQSGGWSATASEIASALDNANEACKTARGLALRELLPLLRLPTFKKQSIRAIDNHILPSPTANN
jgi:aminopeptidase N